MNATHVTRTLILTALFSSAVAVPLCHAVEGGTLAALKLAYNREVSAEKHYIAFAKRAERASEPRIAFLFRAAARGEAVHAAGLLAQIERMGARVTPDYESVVVRDPESNLAAAIERERLEREQVYRVFADFARSECDYAALAAMNYARNAEGTHELSFKEALDEIRNRPRTRLLASLFGSESADLDLEPRPRTVYYTCPGCGSVFAGRPARSCVKCGTAGGAFETFGSS